MAGVTTTLRISNIPLTAIAKDLHQFFEKLLGKDTVYALEIFTERKNWKSKGMGRIQFETIDIVNTVNLLHSQGKLVFNGTHLSILPSFREITVRPSEVHHRIGSGVLHVGFLAQKDLLNVLESWETQKMEIMPERKRVEIWVVQDRETYKLVIQFGDILSSSGCSIDGDDSNGVLLKLKHAPKIYRKVFGPTTSPNIVSDRYFICKENFEFLWVRTTDISLLKSIGKSSSFFWQVQKGKLASDILTSFPHYEERVENLTLEKLDRSCFASDELVPLVRCPSDSKLSYEALFLLNSLVHAQKISITAVTSELIEILSHLNVEIVLKILRKLHNVKSTSYDVVSFVQHHLDSQNGHQKYQSPRNSLAERNLMSCHRVLITPTKVYCLGPEVETSNYVVKHFAEYANDFMRVSFVEEDWSKLPSDAITTTIEQGIFSKPYRTRIYHRVLSILKDGFVIGSKRFEFLAFSASQLRSSSIWMFASNDKVNSQNIREWMGCFNKIRTVSKCAARMGQLFSSSVQTLNVPARDVEMIPDVEATNDGVNYCFSDGIGKISLFFAKQVAQKCGLNHVPSAFQIRYGGYKGVIAVDRNSFHKLSLRPSMQKFESDSRMLNITSWTEFMPCYLNREIISLLSTLGIEDEHFLSLQHDQIDLLDKMLISREAALSVLNGMNGGEVKNILVKMLLQGYEPNSEPYLFMILRAHYETQCSDIRSRCRIFVPKGRVMMGCLDETETLSYGQVFIRVSMTRAELQCGSQSFFQKVDDKTSIVVGKVVVTKNPCLHPGDIRVLEAVYEPDLEEKNMVDCLVFPQKGERPHPNECSGGDLDGDLYFVSWDENLIPSESDTPMDYIARRPRVLDHDVTLEEIQKFFVDYMINDTLGMISTAHLVHADREPEKARSTKCRQLANLHSMAVDFAKTGAPAEMPRQLRPNEYPDFMEREDRASYISSGVLGKLYRSTIDRKESVDPDIIQSKLSTALVYDHDLEVKGFEAFLETAESHKNMYAERLSALMKYYGAEMEEEMLTGNLRDLSVYLLRDKRRYTDMKDRVLDSVKNLKKEAKEWFHGSCKDYENTKMASAWYHVTYHPRYCQDGKNFLSFPWIVGDILLNIKSIKSKIRD